MRFSRTNQFSDFRLFYHHGVFYFRQVERKISKIHILQNVSVLLKITFLENLRYTKELSQHNSSPWEVL